jgi:uncharacterized protein (DUF1330 family)
VTVAAYIVADIEITDPATYEVYKPLATVAIEKYGAKILARGGAIQVAEGEWSPKRCVILEFSSLDHLKQFYYSPEYNEARTVRQKASRSNLIFVEGI